MNTPEQGTLQKKAAGDDSLFFDADGFQLFIVNQIGANNKAGETSH